MNVRLTSWGKKLRRQPSWGLCRQLAGAEPGGNVGDLADLVAVYLENAESIPEDRASDPPTLADAQSAVSKIRQVLDLVDVRLKG